VGCVLGPEGMEELKRAWAAWKPRRAHWDCLYLVYQLWAGDRRAAAANRWRDALEEVAAPHPHLHSSSMFVRCVHESRPDTAGEMVNPERGGGVEGEVGEVGRGDRWSQIMKDVRSGEGVGLGVSGAVRATSDPRKDSAQARAVAMARAKRAKHRIGKTDANRVAIKELADRIARGDKERKGLRKQMEAMHRRLNSRRNKAMVRLRGKVSERKQVAAVKVKVETDPESYHAFHQF